MSAISPLVTRPGRTNRTDSLGGRRQQLDTPEYQVMAMFILRCVGCGHTKRKERECGPWSEWPYGAQQNVSYCIIGQLHAMQQIWHQCNRLGSSKCVNNWDGETPVSDKTGRSQLIIKARSCETRQFKMTGVKA